MFRGTDLQECAEFHEMKKQNPVPIFMSLSSLLTIFFTLSCEPTVLSPVGFGEDAGDMETKPVCGDGIPQSELGETCDDGNRLNGDGCSEACLIECGYRCGTGDSCVFDCDLLRSQVEDGVCEGPLDHMSCCGDGIIQADLGEICDDGNLLPNDDCEPFCGVII